MRRGVQGLGALTALALLLGAGGCSTYKYFDIHVTFDSTVFTDASVGVIHRCVVTVSGADKSRFTISNCPNTSPARPDPENPLDIGSFEYSTFATSGTLDFKLETYVGMNETLPCKSGEGDAAIPVTSMTDIMGSLVVNMNVGPQASCNPNVTPPTDGGP